MFKLYMYSRYNENVNTFYLMVTWQSVDTNFWYKKMVQKFFKPIWNQHKNRLHFL